MVRRFEELLQQPYYFHAEPLSIHPKLAADVASLVRRNESSYFSYEANMLEPPQSFGPGCEETGQNVGFGASFTNPAEALAKSVFEAWERRTSKVYNPESLVNGSCRELAPLAVSPEAFSLISDWEYQQSPLNYVRYNAELRLSWKECFQVVNGSLKPALIPATLVYSRFSWRNPAERFAPNLSPGLACHSTYREAFLNGLCELIERDAFMLNWLHRRSPPLIRPETIDFCESTAALASLRSLGFSVHFLNITSDIGIPVVLTLIEHRSLPWEGTLVPGLGCHLDPHTALRKSFLEALVMLENFATLNPQRSEILLKRRSMPFGLKSADYFPRLQFLVSSTQTTAMDEITGHDRADSGRNLDFLIRHLNGRGHDTYFVDLTPPGYESCRLCLTRALITGLQPMLYEPDCWRLNKYRLFGSGPAGFERLNLMPHPFMLME